MRLLVIDDDPAFLDVVSKRSNRLGLLVHGSTNQTNVLKTIHETNPDIILLSTQISNCNGLDILQEIRNNYSGVELPVIMTTTSTEKNLIISCLKAGANDYISKPIDFDVAHYRIQNLIKLARFHQKSVALHEKESIDAMVTTYNHQINSPLMVIRWYLEMQKGDEPDKWFYKAEEAVDRIESIVKRTREVLRNPIKLATHEDSSKMFDISSEKVLNIDDQVAILLDDDSERQKLIDILTAMGFTSIHVMTSPSRLILDLQQRVAEDGRISTLFCQWNPNRITEILDALRAHPVLYETKFILLSQGNTPGLKDQVMSYGISGVLPTPLTQSIVEDLMVAIGYPFDSHPVEDVG